VGSRTAEAAFRARPPPPHPRSRAPSRRQPNRPRPRSGRTSRAHRVRPVHGLVTHQGPPNEVPPWTTPATGWQTSPISTAPLNPVTRRASLTRFRPASLTRFRRREPARRALRRLLPGADRATSEGQWTVLRRGCPATEIRCLVCVHMRVGQRSRPRESSTYAPFVVTSDVVSPQRGFRPRGPLVGLPDRARAIMR